jgi:hypothetical protein
MADYAKRNGKLIQDLVAFGRQKPTSPTGPFPFNNLPTDVQTYGFILAPGWLSSLPVFRDAPAREFIRAVDAALVEGDVWFERTDAGAVRILCDEQRILSQIEADKATRKTGESV